MEDHLLKFTKRQIDGKSEGYLFILWAASKMRTESGRLSDQIKKQLNFLGMDLVKVNFKNKKRHYKRFLQCKSFDSQETLTLSSEPISSIQLSNFRGFGSLNDEDEGTYIPLNKHHNIFYAPNGGGKTSLCEAFEYFLTGNIKEATRRKTKLSDYIKRASGRPKIEICDVKGGEIQGHDLHALCFIDRNRLQEFSLLGSKDTKGEHKDILASLFGLEQIDDLIDRFVQPNSFRLGNYKSDMAQRKLQAIEDENKGLLINRTELRDTIINNQNELLNLLEFRFYDLDSITRKKNLFSKLLELKRTKLTASITQSLPQIQNYQNLHALTKLGHLTISRLKVIRNNLSNRSNEINFKNLYEAIKDIKNNGLSGETCPACDTPLGKVIQNPFSKADHELNNLEELSTLQEEESKSESRILLVANQMKDIAISYNRTIKDFEKLRCNSSELDQLVEKLVKIDSVTTLDENLSLLKECHDFVSNNKELIEDYITSYNATKLSIESMKSNEESVRNKIQSLEQRLKRIDYLVENNQENEDKLKDIRKELSQYITKRKLIDLEIDNENIFNDLIDNIESSYEDFYRDLKDYKVSIEEENVSGIEDSSLNYYQWINKHDDESECVSSIKFERNGYDYRIVLDVNGEDKDAFSSLSEGHLRALGLSLLLSVAKKNNLPYIIFDDVVNAIDSDHRANIVEMLYKEDYLSNIQQLLTTHDRLFWERYCNTVLNLVNKEKLSSNILSYTNYGVVCADYDANFQKKIKLALEKHDIRQSLIYLRIWLETMVTDYCVENNIEVTAKFGRDINKGFSKGISKGHWLQISLEKTYSEVYQRLAWDTSNLNVIKKDLINWDVQNQEHHAFDEGSYNFVHSKTSQEVVVIYAAVSKLELQLFPNNFRERLTKEKEGAESTLQKVTQNLTDPNILDNAPAQHIESLKKRKRDLEETIDDIDEKLTYITTCLHALSAEIK
ncbi:MAG: AAA family ATPase [Pseudomonadota bacterium]|nr:AAA family ATPase [Pseudomonadota bacterium]